MNGNRKELTLDELKSIELEILKKFDEICKENSIKYSLAYGSMLGAVRHQGFIPWDDDIDVVLMRNDYEKLLQLKYKDNRFEIKSHRYSKNYYYPFAKMVDTTTDLFEPWRADRNMGVFLDIFPIDSFDFENDKDRDRFVKKVDKKCIIAYLMGHKLSHHKELSIKYFVKLLFLIITYPFKKLIISSLDNYCLKTKNGKYCGILFQNFTINKIRKADFNKDTVNILFEDFIAPIYSDYDYLLTTEYGDYMKLPSEEERVSNHYFKAYSKGVINV